MFKPMLLPYFNLLKNIIKLQSLLDGRYKGNEVKHDKNTI
jgi:hypothetical protein